MFSIIILALIGQCSKGCQQQAIVQQVQTPYVANVVVPYTDPFWTYVVGQQEELRAQKIERLNDRIRDLEQQLKDCQQGKLSPPTTGSSPLDEQVQRIFAASCVRCHSGPNAKGSLSLDADGSYDVATKLSIVNEIEHGRMPPAPDPVLADQDFKTIREWANADQKAVKSLLRQNRSIPTPAPPSPGPQSNALPRLPTREQADRRYRLNVPVELRPILDDSHSSPSGEVRGIVDTQKESTP